MLERRVLLLSAVAAAVAAPAFAQTSAPKPGAMSDTKAAPVAGGAMGGAMGAAEQKYMMDTLAAGSMSLESSKVALKKAKDDDIQEFAEFEVAEQETIADVLMSMKDPSKASGKMNPPSDAEVRQHIPQDDQAMLKKMEQMESGKEFDAAYVKAQTQGHEKLLKIQEDYLASGKDPAHLNVAKLARGMIKEHLTLLADLRDEDDDKSATTGKSKK